jgi:hypothetical protein
MTDNDYQTTTSKIKQATNKQATCTELGSFNIFANLAELTSSPGAKQQFGYESLEQVLCFR